jgi:hypothetical protein
MRILSDFSKKFSATPRPQQADPAGRFGALLAREAETLPAAEKLAPPGHPPAGIVNDPDRSQQTYRRARALMGALKQLQASLLVGGSSSARDTLAALCTDADSNSEDPELQGIMQDIALRCAVELARAG